MKSKNIQTLVFAIIVACAGLGWFVDVANLMNYFFFGSTTLSKGMIVFTSFSFVSLVFPCIVYASFSIIKEEQVKIWTSIACLLTLLMYLEAFVLLPLKIVKTTDLVIISHPFADGFSEVSYAGYGLFYIILTILSGIIFGIFIFRFGFYSQIPIAKVRGLFFGLGLIFFSFFSIGDSYFADDLRGTFFLLILFTRICIILSLFAVYIGVTTPNFILKKFNISQ